MNTSRIIFIILLFVTQFGVKANDWDKAAEIVRNLNPVTFPDKTYKITDFGAIGDNKTYCKQAFDSAITICSKNGGGTIIVASGDYYMNGPLVFQSNVNIELQKGATLHFSTNEDDYLPAVLSRWEGTEVYNFSPLIYAYHVNNIALTGEGVVNGNGSKYFSKWKGAQKADQALLRKMGRENTPVYQRVFGKGHKLRPGFIEPYGCSNVRFEGITIYDSPFWVLHPIYCTNVIVRNVIVDSYNTNNDGCDPESCKDVLIENCTFRTGDDAIAIKAGRDNDAWRVGCPTENIVVRNCKFFSKINGICIGSEMSGGVNNVFFENISIPKSTIAIYFKSNLDRGGYIKNVFVRNITVDTAKTALISFETNYKNEKSGFYPTLFQNFVLEDITCKESTACGVYMSGINSYPLENIVLRNVTIGRTDVPYGMKYTKNITFDNVSINNTILEKSPKEKDLVKLKTQ